MIKKIDNICDCLSHKPVNSMADTFKCPECGAAWEIAKEGPGQYWEKKEECIGYTGNLETVIKEIATGALTLCSVIVAADVMAGIQSNTRAKAVMSAVKALHASCTQDAVKKIFDKD